MRISGWSSYVCSADLAFYHAPVTDHAKTVLREWRRLNCHPTSPKPPIIIAQVCGSGMTLIGPSRPCWTSAISTSVKMDHRALSSPSYPQEEKTERGRGYSR